MRAQDAAVLLASGLCMLASHAAAAAKKPFALPDAIAWTAIVNFDNDPSPNPRSGTASFSPAGGQFLIQTRHGAIVENAIADTLILYETNRVADYLSNRVRDAPAGRRLVQRLSQVESGRIGRVQWLSDREVGFISADSRNINQAFVVDTVSGVATQVTHSDTPVLSLGMRGEDVLFLAHAPREPLPTMGVVGDKPLGAIMAAPDADSTPLELFIARRGSGAVTRVAMPAMRLFEPFHGLWISPSGRYAVAFAPAINAPRHWAEYRIPEYELYGYTPERARGDPTSLDLIFRTRYVLIDLHNNEVRPLLDAPSGWLSQNYTPLDVFWMPDETTVVVTNAYLPLDVEDAATRSARAARPAIAEVNLATGEATPVFWEPVLNDSDRKRTGGRMPWRITAVDWDPEARALFVTKRIRRGEQIEFQTAQVLKVNGEWRVRAGGPRPATEPLSVKVRQSLTERPVVYAGRGRVDKPLFDPNPNAHELSFGRAEVVRWRDEVHDLSWQGGVIYPTNYVSGQRYPLIVQTHGFEPDQFLIDGPAPYGSSAMAARVFANNGFVVLQIEDKPIPDPEREGQIVAAGYYAAIQSLIASGLVDAQRVGLIAFSRTGFPALHLLAQHPQLLKAITLCDSVQIGYMTHMITTNLPQELVLQLRTMSGGAPALEHIGGWFEQNPLYRLPRAATAVRIEANDVLDSLLGLWETYALLRTAERPVELVYFPHGSHVQMRPAERLGSQGGNLDWFKYWLQDQETPGEDKSAQYARWRLLRELHERAMQPAAPEKAATD